MESSVTVVTVSWRLTAWVNGSLVAMMVSLASKYTAWTTFSVFGPNAAVAHDAEPFASRSFPPKVNHCAEIRS